MLQIAGIGARGNRLKSNISLLSFVKKFKTLKFSKVYRIFKLNLKKISIILTKKHSPNHPVFPQEPAYPKAFRHDPAFYHYRFSRSGKKH